jgi:hypothetical protein
MGTVVVHDYFAIRGGGERLALLMAEGLEASLVSGYRTAESFEPSMFPAEHLELGLARLLRIPGRRAFALAPRFARQRPRMARFRNRIFSGVAAPFAAPEREGGATNLFYCHTPPRFLYDLREHYSEGRLGRALATRAALGLFQAGYERAIGRMDLVVANSNAVRTRIERFLGRSADVVHPPCEVDRYAWREPEGYYLSMARLAAEPVPFFAARRRARRTSTSPGPSTTRRSAISSAARSPRSTFPARRISACPRWSPWPPASRSSA